MAWTCVLQHVSHIFPPSVTGVSHHVEPHILGHLHLLLSPAHCNLSLSSQLAVEYHKRFDPIYSDARNRARNLGPFSYFYSYMAQPKQQLDTFKAWAGKSSDINYYLNSHHIDVHNWMVSHMSHPTKVTALAATGGRGPQCSAMACCG